VNLLYLKRLFLGRPLSNDEAPHEHIPKWKALAVLSSDALSSVAYATEEVLIPLVLFASAAIVWSLPIAFAVAALLIILTLSYRQTIQAYPNGGGAYIVAKDNLGEHAGLVAGAALLIDYVLTVAVSVAAGVENITSAFPVLYSHRVLLGSSMIIIIMLINLRGVRESATIFAFPTYFFVFSFIVLILSGMWQLFTGTITSAAPIVHEVYPSIPIFLLLRAFSSGCVALTGIEAISNAVPIFQPPHQRNAKITMAWMAVILGIFFLCITLLSHVYGITPKEGETVISLLARMVFGNSFLYYAIPISTALILLLAANTSYAGFPSLNSLIAADRFLPRQLRSRGDRLVFSNGIIGLSISAIVLLILFKGKTHRLIPLYSVGVFVSFTLSQAGMVLYHFKHKKPGWMTSSFFNALGAVTTCVVLGVVVSTKFIHGAWLVAFLIPSMVLVFTRIHRHYLLVGKELTLIGQLPSPEELKPVKHTVIIPVSGIHRGILEALRYALTISTDVKACYIEFDPETTERLKVQWQDWAPHIPLEVIKSPYRAVVRPLLRYIDRVEHATGSEMVTVIIPEFVTKKWYHNFLHNQTALFIRTALLFKPRKVVTTVHYHLRKT